jgi:hypothetical protein
MLCLQAGPKKDTDFIRFLILVPESLSVLKHPRLFLQKSKALDCLHAK